MMTVSAKYTRVIPTKASPDNDFPQFERANVIIEDLATIRDYMLEGVRGGWRPTELELVAKWESHKPLKVRGRRGPNPEGSHCIRISACRERLVARGML